MRNAVGGYLLFGHRFEQGALRLRRGAVDFIGQHELREQRAGMELKLATLAFVYAHADNVRRQQVAGELHALKRQIERGGEGVRQGGLADAGKVFDQQVTASEKAGEREPDLRTLSEHDIVDLLLRPGQRGGKRRIDRCGGRLRYRYETGIVHGARECMGLSIGNVNVPKVPRPHVAADRWRTAFWAAWAVVVIMRLVLAASLAPFGDEAWYWQESRALDWSYSDLPLATAWLIRLGESVLGHGVLPMRAPFLILGAMLPLIVVRSGRRMFGDQAGWCAGLLVLAMPLFGTLGIFALPDVPLTLFSALALDAIERASRERSLRAWLILGLALAGAWLSHYRAAMLFFAGLVFLCFCARGRSLWRTPGLWIALAISCIGLVPLLAFNLEHDWAGLKFQLIDRNPWSFHADALIQPIEQAIVCTPLFYLMLLWAGWQCLRRARSGAPWDLLAACSAVPIVAFFVLGCFADDTRFRVHWPLPGYLPLVLALPPLLAQLAPTRAHRSAIAATFVLLVAGNIAAFAYLAAAAVPVGAAALTRIKAFPEHFVGWDSAFAQTRTLLDEPRFKDSVLVADNFMMAAELDFAFDGARPVYSLDHPINTKHGRAPQLRLWNRDETALHALGSRTVLLIAEPTARRERERAEWMQTLCSRVDDLAPVAALDPFGGRKKYRWFEGQVPGPGTREPGPECPAVTQ